MPKVTLANSKWVIVIAVTTLSLFFGWTFYMRYYFQFPSALDDPLVPPYFMHAEDAKPLPRTLDPSQFQASEVREAYAVANEMPDILAQQPCYCRQPVLRSLLDCFANLEAANCEICVEEARLVAQLHRQGKTASEIRVGASRKPARKATASSGIVKAHNASGARNPPSSTKSTCRKLGSPRNGYGMITTDV